MKYINALIALLFVVGLSACKDAYSEHQQVTGTAVWKAGEKHTFKANIENNAPEYDVVINLRHTPSVTFNDFNLVLTTTSPDGKSETKDVVLKLRKPNSSEMLGGCSGHFCDTETVIIPKHKFPATGTYTYEMTAKSNEDFANIIEIGLIIREIEAAK